MSKKKKAAKQKPLPIKVSVEFIPVDGKQEIYVEAYHGFKLILSAEQQLEDGGVKLHYKRDDDYDDFWPLVDVLAVGKNIMKHIATDLDAKREATV